jgi:hypothetical protein
MPHAHQIHQRSGSSPRRDGLCRVGQWYRAGATVVALPLITALLGACGSSPATASSAEVKQTCKQVEAVLSDGPEAKADPLGYAQAQILPLRQIRTSDKKLHQAIDDLAAAYQTVAAERRAERAASAAVSVAVDRVDAICPGAAA